jgi:hypothetical protein
MDRRKRRLDAIMREIRRAREGLACPAPVYPSEPWQDDFLFAALEPEFSFRAPEPHPRTRGEWVVHWLIRKGGMCVVVLAGLMFAGLAAALLVGR